MTPARRWGCPRVRSRSRSGSVRVCSPTPTATATASPSRTPAGLERLPAFLGDDLDPARSDGDLCIQACADDPQVAVHAIRNLSRIAFGRARIRWSQLGFGRTSMTTTSQATPRNLFGFKDGTANILADDTAGLDEHVWVSASDEPAWMAGGSYLVARKIAMIIESWDRVRLSRAAAHHRTLQGRGCSALGRRRVHRARLSGDGCLGPAGDRCREPRAPGASEPQRRRPDPASRIQLRRRQQRARPARRGTVLPLVPARAGAVRDDPARRCRRT